MRQDSGHFVFVDTELGAMGIAAGVDEQIAE